jgi:AraC-like DNA-binding protein
MDAFAGLLDGPHARQAFLLRSVMRAPWSLHIRDEAPLTVAAIVRGQAWVAADEAEPMLLEAGDVAVFRGPDHYTVASGPDERTTAVIHPGQVCESVDGQPLAERMDLGVRTWGNDPEGGDEMLTGTYNLTGDVSGRLLNALPEAIVLRESEWDCPVIPLLLSEIGKDDPGQEAVLDRLLDLLLISVLRAWFDRPDAQPPGWYRAHADPVVGPALRLLQHSPAEPWTVASLAAEIGVSRAALARRFHELVGEPPMTFLTGWRIALAADKLREPGATVGSVAHDVGYGSPFALSTAFKRVRGVSPAEHRRVAAAAA